MGPTDLNTMQGLMILHTETLQWSLMLALYLKSSPLQVSSLWVHFNTLRQPNTYMFNIQLFWVNLGAVQHVLGSLHPVQDSRISGCSTAAGCIV